jgi:hypothetical protein
MYMTISERPTQIRAYNTMKMKITTNKSEMKKKTPQWEKNQVDSEIENKMEKRKRHVELVTKK